MKIFHFILMSCIRTRNIFFVLLLTGILVIPGWGVCSQELIMGWEPWEPYQYKDSDQNLTGLDIELILAIAANAGYTISFEEIPWQRQLEYLKNGEVHLATGASKTREREAYVFFSDPYRTESIQLYVRNGESAHYPFERLEDIIDTKFQLGVSRGYFYGENYEKLMENHEFSIHVQEVTDDTFNYLKLIVNRIDGFLADPMSFRSVLRKKGLEGKIEAHPMKIYSTNIFIIFSKEAVSPATVKAFNESLIRIKSNGKYQQILKKYLK